MPRQDSDLKIKSIGRLRKEIMRIRTAIRKHRDAKDNSRCWHNDLQLYEKTLPEVKPAGRMNLPEDVLFRNCKKYIRRQKCQTCPIAKTAQRKR